jgi:predicted metal-dependent HD superfamily phosphohydrolase
VLDNNLLREAAKYIPEQCLPILASSYSEPIRRYHNINHIFSMWNNYIIEARSLNDDLTNIKTALAILFHDFIYIPGSKTNELESANFFWDVVCTDYHEESLMATIGAEDLIETYHGILATKDHFNPKHDDAPFWIQQLLDLDLFEIGSPWEVYEANGINIENEYCFVFTKEEYLSGRKKWLEGVLASPKIFRVFTDREEQARKNLEADLKRL